jgi:hypothetical protein
LRVAILSPGLYSGQSLLGWFRHRPADDQVAHAAQLRDRPVGHVRRERLAVPVGAVLDLGEALALDRLGDDDRRLLSARVAGRLDERVVDHAEVVPVDFYGPGAEGHGPLGVGGRVPA